jgi:UPF0716 family protein affecting phage T7 exclusion
MADRTRREPDPFLDWKVRVFFAGAALLVPGVLLGYDPLVLLAIVILAGGLMLLTALGARRRRQAEAAAAEEWEEEADGQGAREV